MIGGVRRPIFADALLWRGWELHGSRSGWTAVHKDLDLRVIARDDLDLYRRCTDLEIDARLMSGATDLEIDARLMAAAVHWREVTR